MKRVARISVSPVKGFRLSHPDEVALGADGVEDNRRFFLVDADGQRLRELADAVADAAPRGLRRSGAELLRMHFPDGTRSRASARRAR